MRTSVGDVYRPHSTTPTPTSREEIARVGRKDVGVSGESVSWNAALRRHVNNAVKRRRRPAGRDAVSAVADTRPRDRPRDRKDAFFLVRRATRPRGT